MELFPVQAQLSFQPVPHRLSQDELVMCQALSELDLESGRWWLDNLFSQEGVVHPPYWMNAYSVWAIYLDGWRSCQWMIGS